MNMSYQVTSSGGSGISVGNMNAITINTQQIGHISSGMMSDDLSEPSSPDSSFDASDLLSSSVQDDVTAQLAAAGGLSELCPFAKLREFGIWEGGYPCLGYLSDVLGFRKCYM